MEITEIEIDGTTWIRTDFDERLVFIKPKAGWPEIGTTPLRKALIKDGIDMVCFNCGTTEHLEAHHINPIKYKRYRHGNTAQIHKGEDHTADNGQWLCRECHRNEHQRTTAI